MRLVKICHISVSLHCVVLETLSILTLFNSTESIVQFHACNSSICSYSILIFRESYLSKHLSEAINTLHFCKLFRICNPPIYVRVGSLFTCGKQLHDRILLLTGEISVNKTSLTPPLCTNRNG